MTINVNVLKTGSKGNCIIVNDNIMLDCGVSYKIVKPYLKDIKLIFVSHIHKDHLNPTTVKKIAYEYPNIKWIVGITDLMSTYTDSLIHKLLDFEVSSNRIIVVRHGVWFDIGMCKVKCDMLYHDVPNSALHLDINGEKMLYATDTSKIDHIVAKDYNLYLIEANHLTKEELQEQIVEAHKNGEFTYLERVKDTHLSQLEALNWLDKNKEENSKWIFIHEHIDKEIKNE